MTSMESHERLVAESPSQFVLQGDEELFTSVVEAVSATTGTSITGLEPLAYTIDPTIIESYEAALKDDAIQMTGSLQFEYSGCNVTIEAEGEIHVNTR